MTFHANEYSPDNIGLPNYKQTSFDLHLEMAVLGKKNSEQEKALRTISDLQQRSLNISMLNQEGKQKLDAYNKKLNDNLSGDLGDLTKIENQNKIAGLFQEISGDTELIKASKLSQQYMKEYENVQSLKNSGRKDSGYSEINEYVWMNWDGGYNDFATKSLGSVTDPNFRPSTYSAAKDLRVPLANLAKLLHEETVSRQNQVMGEGKQQSVGKDGKPVFDKAGNPVMETVSYPTGYLTKNTYGGISPERVKALYEEQLGPDGVSQLEVMSKYEILKHRGMGTVEPLYNQYKAFQEGQTKTYQNLQKEESQRLLFNNEKLKQSNLSQEDKIKLLEENSLIERNLANIDANLTNLEGAKKEKSDFLKLSNPELLNYVYQLQKDEKIKNAVTAFSWKKDLQELSPDATYLAAKKIDAMMAQTKIREDGANNRLVLAAKLKAEYDKTKPGKPGEPGDPSKWSSADISKNPQELLSSYDRLVGLQDQYAKMTDNMFEAPSFDAKSISAKNWPTFYANNKGNYYVEMWDTFKGTTSMAYDKDGNPNIQAFSMWVKDQENNPSDFTRTQVDQHRNNQYVHDYLTSELGQVDGTLRANMQESKLLLPYARDENGNQLNEQDLYSGREIYINVPTSPKGSGEYRGNYQKKKLSDLLYDLDKAENAYVDAPVNSITGMPYYGTSKGSYLDNDPGLKQVLKAYQAKSKDANVLKVLENKLPQWEQFGYTQTSDKDEIQPYEAQISASAKNQSDSFRTLLSVGGIESIAIPKGAGTKGIVKFKSEYAEDLKSANIMLPTRDGNVLELVEPGKAYLFDTQPIGGRDVFLNVAAKSRPYESTYLGWKYKIETLQNGTQAVTLMDDKGLTLPPQPVSAGKDIAETIRNVQMTIQGLKKK